MGLVSLTPHSAAPITPLTPQAECPGRYRQPRNNGPGNGIAERWLGNSGLQKWAFPPRGALGKPGTCPRGEDEGSLALRAHGRRAGYEHRFPTWLWAGYSLSRSDEENASQGGKGEGEILLSMTS